MKHEIEIEGLPEGWRAVAYRSGKCTEWAVVNGHIVELQSDSLIEHLIVEKIKPRRIVLEETEEINLGGCYTGPYNSQIFMDGSLVLKDQPKIWRVVEEE